MRFLSGIFTVLTMIAPAYALSDSTDSVSLDSDKMLLEGVDENIAMPSDDQIKTIEKAADLERAHALEEQKIAAREAARAEAAEAKARGEIEKWAYEEGKYKQIRLEAEEATIQARDRQNKAVEASAQAKQAAEKAREDYEKQILARDEMQIKTEKSKQEADANKQEMITAQAALNSLVKTKPRQPASAPVETKTALTRTVRGKALAKKLPSKKVSEKKSINVALNKASDKTSQVKRLKVAAKISPSENLRIRKVAAPVAEVAVTPAVVAAPSENVATRSTASLSVPLGPGVKAIVRDCNMRAQPTSDSALLEPVGKGTTLHARPTPGTNWLKVKGADGVAGYMNGSCFH